MGYVIKQNSNISDMNNTISTFDSKDFSDGTILDVVNSFSHLPASFMKVGGTMISDAPEEMGVNEFACIVCGNRSRRIVLLSGYSNLTIYTRAIFQDKWMTSGWKNISK